VRKKLVRVLDAKAAYPILFASTTSSPVPKIIQDYTKKEQKDAVFVQATQDLAKHLHQVQHGAISPGLLYVIEFASRRLATFVAFVGNLEAAALDDALDFRKVSDSLAPNRRDWYMLQRLLSETAPHESIP
jgi:hypothetical protein